LVDWRGILDRPGPPKLINISFFGQQELQERLLLKAARLRDRQEKQVLMSDSFEECPRDLPLYGQLPDRPFGHVVVPGDAVLAQERE